MQDDSITPNPSQEPDADDNGYKVYAPSSALEVQGTQPEVGDEVEFTVKGTVNSVEGDVVCVKPETINDQPAPQGPAVAQEQPSERDRLMAQAQADDQY